MRIGIVGAVVRPHWFETVRYRRKSASSLALALLEVEGQDLELKQKRLDW